MNVQFKDGLLFISIEVCFKGKVQIIENIVIDTEPAGHYMTDGA
jgi:hypothetical protein